MRPFLALLGAAAITLCPAAVAFTYTYLSRQLSLVILVVILLLGLRSLAVSLRDPHILQEPYLAATQVAIALALIAGHFQGQSGVYDRRLDLRQDYSVDYRPSSWVPSPSRPRFEHEVVPRTVFHTQRTYPPLSGSRQYTGERGRTEFEDFDSSTSSSGGKFNTFPLRPPTPPEPIDFQGLEDLGVEPVASDLHPATTTTTTTTSTSTTSSSIDGSEREKRGEQESKDSDTSSPSLPGHETAVSVFKAGFETLSSLVGLHREQTPVHSTDRQAERGFKSPTTLTTGTTVTATQETSRDTLLSPESRNITASNSSLNDTGNSTTPVVSNFYLRYRDNMHPSLAYAISYLYPEGCRYIWGTNWFWGTFDDIEDFISDLVWLWAVPLTVLLAIQFYIRFTYSNEAAPPGGMQEVAHVLQECDKTYELLEKSGSPVKQDNRSLAEIEHVFDPADLEQVRSDKNLFTKPLKLVGKLAFWKDKDSDSEEEGYDGDALSPKSSEKGAKAIFKKLNPLSLLSKKKSKGKGEHRTTSAALAYSGDHTIPHTPPSSSSGPTPVNRTLSAASSGLATPTSVDSAIHSEVGDPAPYSPELGGSSPHHHHTSHPGAAPEMFTSKIGGLTVHAPLTAGLPFTQTEIDKFSALLRKGETFIKVGRRGPPHTRFVQVDRQFKWITWSKSPGGKLLQRIRVADVNYILKGQQTAPFRRGQRPNEARLSFSLVTVQRSLDLIAVTTAIQKDWIFAVQWLISAHAQGKLEEHRMGSGLSRGSAGTP